MSLAWRDTLLALGHFLRTPTLGRRVAGLLTLAIVLLLASNLATFVMIQRTARFNQEVIDTQLLRRQTRTVLIRLVDAETGQRGYLLTGNADYLQVHGDAARDMPELLDELSTRAEGDPDIQPRVEHLRELAEAKLAELDRTVAMARTGRLGPALSVVRSNEGKAAMDAFRAEAANIDEIMETRLEFRRRQSEWASAVTVAANTIGALLILALAGVSAWLIRRYVMEIQAARDAVSRMNASLEGQVRERTADLTRANEEIQRFAYIVSHDLRAPLVNVMGYTSELEQANTTIEKALVAAESKRKVEADVVTAVREDMPEAIGFIRASTEKMDRLINAILKLSREGRRSLVPELLDMSKMVQGIADSVNHQTAEAGAEIVVEPLPRLESDRLSIEQIFGNLIDNAVKYLDHDRPGRIVVSGHDDGAWVVFRVSDNGRGITARDHERIFELFRRSGRQDRKGEGLGLAFVRNSVRRLGGDITVESELGKGSTFVLKFPTRLILSEAGDY
ncbi:sensor histidine kinase [Brevundimonas sp.]|jgi:signal transduction histidine kinase|uniref:sensor histidine kinase n=1 Tax=Brevundimonas sp. TaxID=1871086 RepID=UPI002ED9E26A